MFQACWVFCFCPNIKSSPAACWELCSEYSLWPACQANDLHLHQGVHLFTQCAHCVLQPDVCTKLKCSLSCGPEILRKQPLSWCVPSAQKWSTTQKLRKNKPINFLLANVTKKPWKNKDSKPKVETCWGLYIHHLQTQAHWQWWSLTNE